MQISSNMLITNTQIKFIFSSLRCSQGTQCAAGVLRRHRCRRAVLNRRAPVPRGRLRGAAEARRQVRLGRGVDGRESRRVHHRVRFGVRQRLRRGLRGRVRSVAVCEMRSGMRRWLRG